MQDEVVAQVERAPDLLSTVVANAFGAALLIALLAWLIRQFLIICPPSEIVVFSGRSHRLADGSTVGFRVLHGGRAFRVPLFETISRMDVRLYAVEVHVTNAFSRGGIPLTVQAIANVKIATDPVRVRHAVERYLGVGVEGILTVARQTLEGVLRETLSQLTPEEVNQNRLKFAEALAASAKDDFDKLGLELDVLKIQNVTDDQQYLQNLGRAQIAAMLRDAQIAENEANQVVLEAQAEARQRAETAQRQAEANVLERRNQLRAEVAQLDGRVRATVNEAEVAAGTARASAEAELQQLRAELAKLQLQVEQVLPAEARAKAEQARSRGRAATEAEQGKAAAEALRLLAEEWNQAGELARDAFVLGELDQLIRAVSDRVKTMQIGELQIVDGGDGESLVAAMTAHPRAVARVLSETSSALGLELTSLIGNTSTQERVVLPALGANERARELASAAPRTPTSTGFPGAPTQGGNR